MNPLHEEDIRNGNALAPGEALLWRGRPTFRGIARDAMHLRGVSAYFGLLFALDAYQAWVKALPVAQAVHDSVPLAAITCLALGILTAIAWLVARTTRYVVTDRRVILHYGLALPATLSIPMSQIAATAVAGSHDACADIVLVLKSGIRMPYLKLWPHARPWHVKAPQPMLRAVPQGSGVGALLTRALQTAERARMTSPRRPVEERVGELLSA